MAEVLLITRNDLVKYTPVNGNVDTDKFIQFIKIAQDIHIQNYLGTALLEKIKTDIAGNDLTDPYLSLVEDHVKWMLIYWAMVEYLPFSAYSIANKGVYKHSAENSENVSKIEVDFLIEKQRDLAQHYTQRFIDYICANNADFPEYNQATNNGEMNPSTDNFLGGWII